MLVYGGRIHTMSPLGCVEALYIEGDRVVAAGKKQVLESVLRPGTTQVCLEGRAVFPGMYDSHIHLNMWSIGLKRIDLRSAKTVQDALQVVSEAAKNTPEGRWILGGRWDKSVWVEFPDAVDLDRVSPAHPVYLVSKDGHSGWANSLAMKIAGVGPDTEAPAGGAILKHNTGRLTGMFQDTATRLIQEHIPLPEFEHVVTDVDAGIRKLHSLGIVGAHVCDGVMGFKVARTLWERGRLAFRIAAMLPNSHMRHAVEAGLSQGFGNDNLFLGPIKMFKDGALGSSTAWMTEPYEHIPGYRGLEVMSQRQLAEDVELAVGAGFGTAIHAIGDLACRNVLDVLEKHAEVSRKKRLRHRIEHAQLLTVQDVARFGQLGVVASVQPSHVVADRYMADREWGDRARWAYAFRSLLDTGAVLAFGSDAPVDEPDPLYGIHCAVNRQAVGDTEAGAWYPEEKMSVLDSIRAYTVGAAYAAGREDVLGDLSPGKLADFVVLSKDITQIHPSEITSAKVEATCVGGTMVYGPLW